MGVLNNELPSLKHGCFAHLICFWGHKWRMLAVYYVLSAFIDLNHQLHEASRLSDLIPIPWKNITIASQASNFGRQWKCD